jgi:uracil-DNA glycosylase
VNDDDRTALADLLAEAGELLELEQAIGNGLIPVAPIERRAAAPARAPAEAPAAPPAIAAPAPERDRRLLEIAAEAATCTRCGLHTGRTKSVFARGSATTDLVFVGEGPGYHEDQEGLPFVGKAGQLLDKMIGAMGYDRDAVYICNVVKCRPPNNRTPLPDEAGACKPFLGAQLELVRPKVIVALGRCAAENLGCLEGDARGWRGRWARYEGVDVMPTYHPAFLLRNPENKRVVWQDLQAVLGKLGRPIPKA